KFIPPKEIWIDGQMSCEETEYSIALELLERSLISKGFTWGKAYDSAINTNTRSRYTMEKILKKMPPVIIPDSVTRAIGKKDE
ncbi:MAG: hypothetical protein Q8867_09700, partial [Bacteroidota bacterium]|nr:hypothetical protein [Bacteroidota bacterium]